MARERVRGGGDVPILDDRSVGGGVHQVSDRITNRTTNRTVGEAGYSLVLAAEGD